MRNCSAEAITLTPAAARGVVASYLDNAEDNADVVYRALCRAELHTRPTPCATETYALLRATLADLTGVERYRVAPVREPA